MCPTKNCLDFLYPTSHRAAQQFCMQSFLPEKMSDCQIGFSTPLEIWAWNFFSKMYCAILISNRHKTTFAVDQPLVTMFKNRQNVIHFRQSISSKSKLTFRCDGKSTRFLFVRLNRLIKIFENKMRLFVSFSNIVNAQKSNMCILREILTIFSTSWGLWRLTVFTAWNTSTSPCWMTCSMQALAAQYTPARDCPSLKQEAKNWKMKAIWRYDLHHREKVASPATMLWLGEHARNLISILVHTVMHNRQK